MTILMVLELVNSLIRRFRTLWYVGLGDGTYRDVYLLGVRSRSQPKVIATVNAWCTQWVERGILLRHLRERLLNLVADE
jgi:hypothetical protein